MKIVKQSVELLWATNRPEEQIERAGRTCYKSEDRITPASSGIFVRRLVDSGHHAMLEHATASFKIVTDRGVSHEIVRHRLVSYAQESTRYCNYSKDKFGKEITVIKPMAFEFVDVRCQAIWRSAMEQSERAYFDLLEFGVTPEIARSVLPTCLKTEIVMTTNLREWKHFILLRMALSAHPQIRVIAKAIYQHLMLYAPNVFGDLEIP